MAAEIRTFTCLNDNFGYLIHDVETKATASIDAPEAGPILKALEREGWQLTDILITHHHGDHVGGVAELKQKYNCRVVAPHDKTTEIANVDLRVANADIVKVGSLLGRVLETPGHTLDHISYVFDNEKTLFAADTLFSIGCGRVFEGDYPMMWDSLLKLRGRCLTTSSSIAGTNTPRPTSSSRSPSTPTMWRSRHARRKWRSCGPRIGQPFHHCLVTRSEQTCSCVLMNHRSQPGYT
ncbi:hydroxyacylglutathione hydrolase [Bradyrhizobium sp. S3.7.6]